MNYSNLKKIRSIVYSCKTQEHIDSCERIAKNNPKVSNFIYRILRRITIFENKNNLS